MGGETLYRDGRPEAVMRLEAKDQGIVFHHGQDPGQCDIYGAQDVYSCVQRTLGITRTTNLDGSWVDEPKPMVPIEEQIENSSQYFEKSNKTWFLFTNHVGIDKHEYTDAIWIYWSRDLDRWEPRNKAVVLDGNNCKWSHKCIGLPSVIVKGNRLTIFYDASGRDSTSHMRRDVGLAWLDLPLSAPSINKSKLSSVLDNTLVAK